MHLICGFSRCTVYPLISGKKAVVATVALSLSRGRLLEEHGKAEKRCY
jgi:hypothetical protein